MRCLHPLLGHPTALFLALYTLSPSYLIATASSTDDALLAPLTVNDLVPSDPNHRQDLPSQDLSLREEISIPLSPPPSPPFPNRDNKSKDANVPPLDCDTSDDAVNTTKNKDTPTSPPPRPLLNATVGAGGLDRIIQEAGLGTPDAQRAAPIENLQTFNGTLGGIPAPAIGRSADGERPFEVEGDDFPDFDSAAQRTCDKQFTRCQGVANRARGDALRAQDCGDQRTRCIAAQNVAQQQTFPTENIGADPLDPEFDLVCDA
ncbi:hypothetical protein K402DRAFT_404339 [Aulographum hederae CBS 113979]|uniref:Uncharacterized protein n=1 Tax=Aulographum hederae CBS 113979 TaxID=1176131 RepID=A0A6G1H0Y1_9PEZI|nr:hypothetical protein K402DRAFT_404339 [Aulographum hederae CBS 113979]